MKEIEELSMQEAQNINGGGPAWEWTGRFLGKIAAWIEDVCDAYSSSPEGHAVQQALHDFH